MAQRCKTNDVAGLRALLAGAFPYGIVPRHTASQHFYEREDTGRVAASVNTKLGFAAKDWLATWKVSRALAHVEAECGRLDVQSDVRQHLPDILSSAKDAGDRIRDEAGGFGTNAHAAVDAYLSAWLRAEGSPDGSSSIFLQQHSRPEEIAACRSFDRLVVEREIIPLASEMRVWYEKGKDCFAGTVDAVLLDLSVRKGRVGQTQSLLGDEAHRHDYLAQDSGSLWCYCEREVSPRLILGDWKTSNTVNGKDEYALQGEAYAKAIEKETGLRFAEVWVIRLSKTHADYEIVKITDRKQAWKEFLATSRAYDARAGRGNTPLLAPLTVKETIRI